MSNGNGERHPWGDWAVYVLKTLKRTDDQVEEGRKDRSEIRQELAKIRAQIIMWGTIVTVITAGVVSGIVTKLLQ